jgi:hypothetical protein
MRPMSEVGYFFDWMVNQYPDKKQVCIENKTLVFNSKKGAYAINPQMLRAVLNGYSINMEVPMKLTKQDRTIKKTLNRLKEEKSERPRLEEKVKGKEYSTV